jgi:hypothetical protein
MPALVAGIHAKTADSLTKEGVDGRDKPGHDADTLGAAHDSFKQPMPMHDGHFLLSMQPRTHSGGR